MEIIKIGGSLITNKSEYRKFLPDKAEHIVEELLKIDDFVLVHGGGSFGHFISEKYNLPGELSEERLRAAAIVKYDMQDLNQMILQLLNKKSRMSIGISPFFLKRGDRFDYSIVQEILEKGLIPVIYGDVYFLKERIGILSGDHIMVSLAEMLHPQRAIFLTDVDGVYDRDPKKFPDAKLVSKYGTEKLSFGAIEKDVTGGMELKFKSMIQCRDLGVKTYVINGNYPERIFQIGSENFVGTEFR